MSIQKPRDPTPYRKDTYRVKHERGSDESGFQLQMFEIVVNNAPSAGPILETVINFETRYAKAPAILLSDLMA